MLSTKISQPLNIRVQRIYSPKSVVTTILFFSGDKSQLACNAIDELTNNLLDPKSERTRASVLKTDIISVTMSRLACALSVVIVKIQVWVLCGCWPPYPKTTACH